MVTIQLIPGYTFSPGERVDETKLNALGNPTVLAEGSLGELQIGEGVVDTVNLKDGALSADSAGRAKMEDGYVTLAKLGDDARIPAGALMPFARRTAPSGWLACDGSFVSTAGANAALAAAIFVGQTEQENDEDPGPATFEWGYKVTDATGATRSSTGAFIRLPDLRGSFVRGLNTEVTGPDASRPYATSQADQMIQHSHGFSPSVPAPTGGVTQIERHESGSSSLWALEDSTLYAGTGNAGAGTETRPDNLAMIYCIKQ